MASLQTTTATVVTTVLSTVTHTTSSATPTSTDRAAEQAGVLAGHNPILYNASNPIQLFIVQAGIIIIFCRLLHYPLKYMGQPRVIAEVIGGILLGPSVLMRIPGFQSNIFPTASMPVLNNTANLGLILFLFLTGLEVDLRVFQRNWRVAFGVATASMILPFALGYAIAWGLYQQFGSEDGTEPIRFAVFGLFVGTALAITAFPVLCRILSELNLLGNNVGVTVLAAGVGNDVVGWILLALCVALVNNDSGLTALWVLLTTVGWVLLLVFAVRPTFIWVLRRNGSLTNGPSEAMVCVTVLLVLTSAWFTGIIGVHPIFGGFLVGIICPHDGGFAIKLTEKLEDFVSAFFLPLYFALSGLSTNLGLLNDGITWGYVIGVIVVAFAGKVIGGMVAARLCKLFWRESLAIGVLMSCKGLVELIVLNIGYQAKILSQRTFTMFVVMAVVTTVSTTPLTKLVYPVWYQQKVEKYRRGEIDWDGNPLASGGSSERTSLEKIHQESQVRRLLVYLRLDSLPGLFTVISLLGGADAEAAAASSAAASANKDGADLTQQQTQQTVVPRRHLQVHGIRLLELTERTSSVMQMSELGDMARRDPVVKTFQTFSQLHDVAVSGQVAIVPPSAFPETLLNEAEETASDFVLIPWGERGVTEDQSAIPTIPTTSNDNDRFSDRGQLEFVQAALERATCTVGVFIDNGFGVDSAVRTERPRMLRTISAISTRSHREPALLPVANKTHRVYFPFVGGADDRAALRFVLQLAKNKNISVTIGSFLAASEADAVDDTVQDAQLVASLRASVPAGLAGRLAIVDVAAAGTSAGTSAQTLDEMVVRAGQVVGQAPKNAGDVIVLGRRHTALGDSTVPASEQDLPRTIGAAAARMVHSNLKASIIVIQASKA